MGTDRRWIELALNPRETLETELKGWLDLRLGEDRANLAHAVLALANHGGGTLLVGYEATGGKWQESKSPPAALDSFDTDAINGIVERFADPSFHCELHIVEHSDLVHMHPVIVVPGGHRVPVRAKRDGPERKHVQKDTYYIRRPGPQSAPPQTADEWQQLIHRCVMTDRDWLLDNLRAALIGEASREPNPSLDDRTSSWEQECLKRFADIVAEKEAASTYALGYYTCAYAFGDRPSSTAKELLSALREAEHQTGWPAWIVFDRQPIAPYPIDGLVECHVFEMDAPREPAHSDFWRAAPDGRFFLLRGFQEDELEEFKGKIQPGTSLDREMPFWRVGECLLHAARMAERLGVPRTSVHVRFTWTGLAGRRLADLVNPWGHRDRGGISRQNLVHSEVTVDADRIRLQLADLVAVLTQPLFESFDFEVPDKERIAAALSRMLQRTGGR
jgi:hypothetical protein